MGTFYLDEADTRKFSSVLLNYTKYGTIFEMAMAMKNISISQLETSDKIYH